MHVEFDATILRAAIEAVMPAMSASEEHPKLNQICIESGKSRSRAAAADGYWACVYEFEAKSVDEAGKVGISARCARKLLALLEGEEGSVLLVTDASLCRFEIERVGRLDERPGPDFPPIDQVWPKGDGERVSSMGMNPLSSLHARIRRPSRQS